MNISALLGQIRPTLPQASPGGQPCARPGLGFMLAALAFFGWLMPTQTFAESLNARVARLAPHFSVTRPEGEGPFAVIVMLHGCGGPRPFIDAMAAVAAQAGAAAIVIDSHKPRRISRIAAFATVCTGARLQGRERAGDLYAAFAWARAQSWADGGRMAVMGWSHGGWTIMDALALRSGAEMERATGLSELPAEPLAGLRRALIVYPYVGPGAYAGRRPWRLNPPSTAIIAGRDYIVGSTRAPLERQRALGAPLDIIVFENATHAFEDAEAEDPRVRYDPAATAREHDMLRQMIAGLQRA